MKKIKRFLVGLLACICIGAGVTGLVSCGTITVNPNNQGGVTITPNTPPNSSSIQQPSDSSAGQTHVHDWTVETVVTEVSCTVSGVKILVCNCGEDKIETTPALGHDRLRIFAKAPTCTEFGWNTYEKCQRDGCEYTTYEKIDALGHDNVEHTAQAATCTDFGWDAYTVCNRCHVSTYQKIEPLGHSYIDGVCTVCMLTNPNHDHDWDNGTTISPASCTTSGVMKYACTVGDCTETKTEEIGALGHDNVKYGAKYPTCEEIGWNAYEVCNRCGHSTYVELPAPGHSFDSGKITTAATCEKDGVKTYTCFCYKTYMETIPAIGHNYGEWTTVTVATCENNGQEKCVCENDNTHVKTRNTEKLGHAYGEWMTATAATCEYNGQEKRVCANDNTHVETRSIDATGHTEVVDEAVAATYTTTGLTEGAHCSVCKKVLIKQEVIPVLSATYHSITYKNIKTAEYPMITSYAEHTGLLDLPVISVEGYKFLGWYTASTGGDIIDYIPEGSTKNYVLFAQWDTKEYPIRYIDAPITNNPDSYTVEDEITLNAPEWSGLSFAYWKDGDNVRTKIEKGTTGEIVLTAHWRYKKNLAVPNEKDRDILTVYDEEKGRYHFIYELGLIDDIVLETIVSSRKDYGQELSWSRTTSVTMEEDIAKTVSESIGKNVSQTMEWSNTTEWATSHSETKGWSSSISLGAEINIKNKVKPKIEANHTQSGSTTDESSWGHAITEGGSQSSGSQIENSYSSTISYVNGSSQSLTETRNIPANMPTGTYTYAYVGMARVYIIITYDAETKDYYVDTYSILENDYNTTVLYELSSVGEQKTNIEENEPLNVEVPVEEIETYINSSWYKVQYDANGGTGTMLTSIFYSGLPHSLYPNQFTRTGYTFIGWKVKDGGEDIYADKMQVTDLATQGETIVLEAQWALNTYTIICKMNDGTTADFARVTYTVEDKSITLSTPNRIYYDFKGWYGDTVGTVTVDLAQLLKLPKDTTILYAKWVKTEYTVTFDANGGSVSQNTKKVVYDGTYGTLPTPTRTNYAFAGWKLGSTIIISGTKVSIGEHHTLTAEWVLKTCYVVCGPNTGYPDKTIKNKNWETDTIYVHLNIAKLKSLGYNKITVDATVDIKEEYDGYQLCRVYTYNGGKECFAANFEHDPGDKNTSWGTYGFIFSISLSDLIIDENGETTFVVKWKADSAYDDWIRGTTTWNIIVQ